MTVGSDCNSSSDRNRAARVYKRQVIESTKKPLCARHLMRECERESEKCEREKERERERQPGVRFSFSTARMCYAL